MRGRKAQPWYSDMRARLRFERGARQRYPDLSVSATGRGRGAEVIYRLTVEMPQYGTRRITIRLINGFEPHGSQITADGPTNSPHRFSSDALCIWHPDDPPEQKWEGEDGLLELINQAVIHLFKEAYWRETGEWLGPEAPHAVAKDPDNRRAA